MKEIKHIEIKNNMKVSELVDEMGNAGFGARKIYEASSIMKKMFSDKECKVFFGVAGAMVPAGMKQIIIDILDNVDVFVTTGANLTHDLIESLGEKHYSGNEFEDDEKLNEQKIDRIYNVFMKNEVYGKLEDFFKKNFNELKECTNIMDFLWKLGELVAKEKTIVKKNIREYLIQEYISNELPKACYSKIELRKTPLGEKVIIHTSRPGLVVGRKGANIQKLTETLKNKFQMENPQVEVAEIENPNLDPKSVAEYIVSSFERFGPKRFKSLGYGALQKIMDAGAQGAEIVITGRGVPSSRSKRWRFLAGHIKKSGDISENKIKRAIVVAELKSGAIGVKVNILTPDVQLPDKITLKQEIKVEEEKKEIKPKETEVKPEIKTKIIKTKEKKQIKEKEENGKEA